MESDSLDPTDAQREQRPFMLEPAELPLDRATVSIERPEAQSLARASYKPQKARLVGWIG